MLAIMLLPYALQIDSLYVLQTYNKNQSTLKIIQAIYLKSTLEEPYKCYKEKIPHV